MKIIDGQLGTKMRALAGQGHERSDELRHMAGEFYKELDGFFMDLKGHSWKSVDEVCSRARRLWLDCSRKPKKAKQS